MIFKCALAIWLRSLTVEISYVSNTGEVVSRKYCRNRFTFFGMHRCEKLVNVNIFEKNFKFAMLIKLYP